MPSLPGFIDRRLTTMVLCLVFVASGAATGTADDWPHWRGANRNGVSNESSGWSGEDWPGKLLWEAKTESGSSAPIVAGGRLYTIGWQREPESRDVVTCLDAESGKTLWTQSYASPEYGRRSEGDKGLYSGPSASPAIDAKTGLLYTLSTDGDLNCRDTNRKGQRVWGLNFYEQYDVKQRPLVGARRLRDYGYTTSPLIYGDWLIAEVGDDEGNLFAFDKRTGKRVWVSQSKDPAGHTGGLVPLTVEGLPCVAVLTIRNLLVARLDKGHEGETLAEFPWETDFANSIATPAVQGSSIIVTSEYNQYSICRVDVSRAGAKQIWKQPYASGVCTPVIHKGHIYWCWRGLYCLSFETGNPLWRGGLFGDTASCLVTSDDRIIVWADRGELVLAETAVRSPKKYTALARSRGLFQSDVWPHIVMSDGRLFCKSRSGRLKCFQTK
jgi:outer membrane protein assembly factor BamB